jgi:NodT family efflux transporter outer membrane factor (OMF) lipoprotein
MTKTFPPTLSKKLLTYSAMLALLSSCSLIPDFSTPKVAAPVTWSTGPSKNAEVAADWWKNFNSPELNDFMNVALQENNDLRASLARVDEARADLTVAGSSLFPTADASGSAGWDRTNPGHGKTTSVSSYRAGADISYELDLFGANRANVTAAEYSFASSQYGHDALSLVVMSDVASAYFQVLNLRERVHIAQENLKNSQDVLKIINARFQAGSISALEVSEQKTNLANTQAALASLQESLAQSENALAVLLGKAPRTIEVKTKNLDKLNIPVVAPGQPSDLILRRPDIRGAESDLAAANANIGAARAAFFPSVTLGLGWTVAASPMSAAATSATSLAGSVLAPIFEGGRLTGNLEFAKARRAELVENYRKTVLTSFQEVEDALAAVKGAEARRKALETALTESRKSYQLSRQQYDAGAVDFQTLLDSQRSLFSAQDAYAQSRLEMLLAAVDLYKALGGGWHGQ